MTIYLVRHGHCATDGVRRYVGQIDYPLSTQGQEEARRWRTFFAHISPLHVVCSDLLRTVQTAREILGPSSDLPLHKEPALREISLGEWEGVPRKEIREHFFKEYEQRGRDLADFRPPGGESFSDLSARVVPVFEDLCARLPATGNLLIITHAGVIRTLLCHSTGMPLQRIFSLGQDYAGLTRIDRTPQGYVVRAMNLCPPVEKP